MQYEVIIWSSCVLKMHYNGNDCSASIFAVGLMHLWNGCRVGPGQTARTFICSALYALGLGGVIGDRCSIWGRNLTLVYTMYNGDDGSALIFVRWMYEMGVVLCWRALDEQAVRLYCCVLASNWRCHWCSIQYEVVISSLYTTLQW